MSHHHHEEVSLSRLTPTSFDAGILTFLIAALVTAIARTAIRLVRARKLYADDWFLFLSVAAYSAGWGILWYGRPNMWALQRVAAGLDPPTDIAGQNLNAPMIALAAMSVFTVKLSFLFLFRRIIRRTSYLNAWWWCVLISCVGTMIVLLILFSTLCGTMTATWQITCPQLFLHMTIELAMGSSLDILTDLMVISIPVFLLWKVQISLRQKVYIGSMLCLSIAVIIIVIVRVAVTTLPSGSPDGPWIGFWQVAEPSFAIIAVSMNAFRSPFVSEKPGSKKSKKSNGYSSQSSARRRQYGANTVDDGLDLPIMPPSALGRDKKIARYRPIDEEAHLGTHPSERYGPDDFTTYRPADRDSEDIFRPVV